MPADERRVRFGDDESRSGSSRASTIKTASGVAGSSTASSYSGAAYPRRSTDRQLYDIHALQDALQATVEDLDNWKSKAYTVEETLRKELQGTKAGMRALKDQCANLENDRKELQDETKALRSQISNLQEEKDELEKRNAKLQKKVRELEASEGKRYKESDSDKEKNRLKERFGRGGDTSSESNTSKPPSSTMSRSSRRMSTSYADKPPYVEPYGQSAPRPPVTVSTSSTTTSGGRRLDGYVSTSKTGYPAYSTMQSAAYASIPRSAGIQRPTVETSSHYSDMTAYNQLPEDGNYHAYPLPPDQRKR